MMRIKRIRAADMQSARDRVRELGPNAVIISVRKLEPVEAEQRGGVGGVEIIAGIDEREAAAANRKPMAAPSAAAAVAGAAAYGRAAAMFGDSPPARVSASPAAARARAQREPVGVAAGAATAPSERLGQITLPEAPMPAEARPLDIDALRQRARQPAGPRQQPGQRSSPEATQPPESPLGSSTTIAERAYELLRAIGLCDEVAETALEQAVRTLRADRLDDLSMLIESALSQLVLNLPDGPRLSPVQLAGKTVFFVGAPGSGKTTSLLKAAFRLQRDGAAVAVVSADASRLGCREQLEGYCHLLDLQFTAAYTPDEIETAVRSVSARTIVLVDTPPLAPSIAAEQPRGADGPGWDPARDGLGPLLAAIDQRCVVLVASATASERELHRLTTAAWRLGASAVVLTHLDDASPSAAGLPGAGAALNCLAQLRLAPLFLGTGRDVLTDCVPLDAYELVIAALETAAEGVPSRTPA